MNASSFHLNPNLAMAWMLSGWVNLWLGQLELAIELQVKAMRLSPYDPQVFQMEAVTAFAHLCAGRYEEASSWASRACRDQPSFLMSLAACASDAHAGRLDGARNTITRVRQLDPRLCISDLRNWTPFRRPEHLATLAEGLRKDGLPE